MTGQQVNLYPEVSLEERVRLASIQWDGGRLLRFDFSRPHEDIGTSDRTVGTEPPEEMPHRDNP